MPKLKITFLIFVISLENMKDLIYKAKKPRLNEIADIITGIKFSVAFLIFSLSHSL